MKRSAQAIGLGLPLAVVAIVAVSLWDRSNEVDDSSRDFSQKSASETIVSAPTGQPGESTGGSRDTGHTDSTVQRLDKLLEQFVARSDVRVVSHIVTSDMIWQETPEGTMPVLAEESPDGNYVAYIAAVPDVFPYVSKLLIRNVHTNEWIEIETALPDADGYAPSFRDFRWTPDGKLLILDQYHENPPPASEEDWTGPQGSEFADSLMLSLRVTDPTSGDSTALTVFEPTKCAFSSNPEGNVTLVTRPDGETISVVKFAPDGGEIRHTNIPFSAIAQNLALTDDGDKLWFTRYDLNERLNIRDKSIGYLDLNQESETFYVVLDEATLYDITRDGSAIIFAKDAMPHGKIGYYSIDENSTTWLGEVGNFPFPVRFAGSDNAVYLRGFREGVWVENSTPRAEVEGLFRLALSRD